MVHIVAIAKQLLFHWIAVVSTWYFHLFYFQFCLCDFSLIARFIHFTINSKENSQQANIDSKCLKYIGKAEKIEIQNRSLVANIYIANRHSRPRHKKKRSTQQHWWRRAFMHFFFSQAVGVASNYDSQCKAEIYWKYGYAVDLQYFQCCITIIFHIELVPLMNYESFALFSLLQYFTITYLLAHQIIFLFVSVLVVVLVRGEFHYRKLSRVLT